MSSQPNRDLSAANPAHRFVATRIFALALLSLPLAAPRPTAAVQRALAPPVLANAVIVGGSVSCGLALGLRTGAPARFARVLEESLDFDWTVALDASRCLFYRSPAEFAEQQIARVLHAAEPPSLVIALDYVFWFVYGPWNEEVVAGKVKEALHLLEAFECPVLVGTVPYMDDGKTALPVAINPRQRSVIDGANTAIRAWARSRQAMVVPIAERFDELRRTEDAAGVRRYLQPDGLHPTVLGAAEISRLAFETLAEDPALGLRRELVLPPEDVARRLVE